MNLQQALLCFQQLGHTFLKKARGKYKLLGRNALLYGSDWRAHVNHWDGALEEIPVSQGGFKCLSGLRAHIGGRIELDRRRRFLTPLGRTRNSRVGINWFQLNAIDRKFQRCKSKLSVRRFLGRGTSGHDQDVTLASQEAFHQLCQDVFGAKLDENPCSGLVEGLDFLAEPNWLHHMSLHGLFDQVGLLGMQLAAQVGINRHLGNLKGNFVDDFRER